MDQKEKEREEEAGSPKSIILFVPIPQPRKEIPATAVDSQQLFTGSRLSRLKKYIKYRKGQGEIAWSGCLVGLGSTGWYVAVRPLFGSMVISNLVLMAFFQCAVSEAVILRTLSYQEAWEMVSTHFSCENCPPVISEGRSTS